MLIPRPALLISLLVAAALLAGVGLASAQNVVGSKHDLTSATGGAPSKTTGTDQVCVFCHTPHAADATAPLWNRTLPAPSSFTMYNSPTIDMTIAAGPQGVSLACLSCHDGTIAFDSLLNKPGSGNGAPSGWTWSAGNLMNATSVAMLGTDLTNDHPISVTYDITKDTAFNAAAGGKVGALPLYGTSTDQVECGTCHNPHLTTFGTFLRVSNAASALCTTCHIK